jgi:hypothetical protein
MWKTKSFVVVVAAVVFRQCVIECQVMWGAKRAGDTNLFSLLFLPVKVSWSV